MVRCAARWLLTRTRCCGREASPGSTPTIPAETAQRCRTGRPVDRRLSVQHAVRLSRRRRIARDVPKNVERPPRFRFPLTAMVCRRPPLPLRSSTMDASGGRRCLRTKRPNDAVRSARRNSEAASPYPPEAGMERRTITVRCLLKETSGAINPMVVLHDPAHCFRILCKVQRALVASCCLVKDQTEVDPRHHMEVAVSASIL